MTKAQKLVRDLILKTENPYLVLHETPDTKRKCYRLRTGDHRPVKNLPYAIIQRLFHHFDKIDGKVIPRLDEFKEQVRKETERKEKRDAARIKRLSAPVKKKRAA